ncbi:acyltransferase family protein [Citrobacter amalonaticus]|uniref:acyltransferase family protein n=1 Tax=Citrobacter amalonaticus TaxID=35703 RepID=UPI0011575FBA|nr:acyltransferase family protein [Citrobacter amalonaticus]QDK86442.1 acyltransferase [Citrobacter amalonaticus]
MNFRTDINGLRAIAVIAVVLYHFGIPGFDGGFSGVDVFFVISGYLMTGIIFSRLDGSKFSVIGFYMDRARRIIPALYFTCFCLLVIGYFLLLPSDYQLLSEHVKSSSLFYSNIQYFYDVNYFDTSSKEKWLLHTWSLSVEWQFYLIYPVFAFVLYKSVGRSLASYSVLIVALLSFAVSIYYANTNSSAGFYLLTSRAWEMSVGGLVYLFPASLLTGRYAKMAGVTIIIAASVLLNSDMAWPSYWALVPVLGCAIVISAGDIKNILLDNKVMQWLGKVSYSLYLTHWPVFVLFNYLGFSGWLASFFGVALSIALSCISFYLVENPSRKILNKYRGKLARELTIVLAAFLSVYLAAFSVTASAGYPGRYPFALISAEELAKERARYWTDGDQINPVPKTGDKKIVIIGNSHGIDLTYALTENGFKGDISYLRTTNHCSNFGYTPNEQKYKKFCSDVLISTLKFDGLKHADVVMLHDDWQVNDMGGLRSVINEIKTRTNARVIVFGPKMMFNNAPMFIAKKAMENKKTTFEMVNGYASTFYINSRWATNKVAKATVSKIPDAEYVDMLSVQCGKSKICNIVSPATGKYLYFDSGHLTKVGATELGIELKKYYPEIFN